MALRAKQLRTCPPILLYSFILTLARTKRYKRLVTTHGTRVKDDGTPGIEITTAASKRKTKADVAQAAEAKRRKIEDDHNDPTADDGDVGQPVKREPGIKQEFSGHYYHHFSNPWPLSMAPSYYPAHPSTLTTTHTPLTRYWPSSMASDGLPPTSSSAPQQKPATSLLAIPIIKLEDEDDVEEMSTSTTASDVVVSHQIAESCTDDAIFADFCTSEVSRCAGEPLPATSLGYNMSPVKTEAQ